MDEQTAMGVLALLGITLSAVIIGAIVLWVLYIVAFWKVFTKAGEPGWKSIIPIYNEYTFYKATWNTTMFWVFLGLGVVGSLMSSCGVDASGGLTAVGIIGTLLSFAAAVIAVIQSYKTSKAYGHGVGFFLGLVFFNWIFLMILGLGSSEYKGAQK